MDSFDALVIGAGEAGSEVANRAVRAGCRVAMMYRPPYGSTCLNAGCVPSKFLIQRLETNVRGIWAIGDVNGHQPYTRVCQEEARRVR